MSQPTAAGTSSRVAAGLIGASLVVIGLSAELRACILARLDSGFAFDSTFACVGVVAAIAGVVLLVAAARQRSLLDAVLVVALLAAGVRFTYHLDSIIDLGLYDEATCLERGITAVADGLPPADRAPLYAAWYRAVAVAAPDPIDTYYLSFQLLTTLAPVALLVLLRGLGIAHLEALAVGFAFLLSWLNLPGWPKSGLAAVVILLLGLGWAARQDDHDHAIGGFALAALVAAYVRPELLLTVFAAVGWFALRTVRRAVGGNWPRRRPVAIGLAVATILVVSLGLPIGGGSGRSFMAFGQHFARNEVARTGGGLDPWRDWQAIVGERFGAATSIGGAALANPRAFARHLRTNLAASVRVVAVGLPQALFRHSTVVLAHTDEGIRREALLLAALVLAYVVARSRSSWLERRERLRRHRLVLGLLGLATAPSLLSWVVIYPREHYQLLPAIGLLTLGCLLVARVAAEAGPRESWVAAGAAVVMVVVTPYLARTPWPRPILATIVALRGLGLDGNLPMLADGRYDVFLGREFVAVNPNVGRGIGFDQLLAEQGLRVIVASPALVKHAALTADPEWHRFLASPAAIGFEPVAVPATDTVLYMRREPGPVATPNR